MNLFHKLKFSNPHFFSTWWKCKPSIFQRHIIWSELGTLEWIKFNPDFLIRISTEETFHLCPNPLFFSLLWYQLIVFSNENISVLSFKIILQDYVNLEIIKQRGSNINPDIHHSKVPSSQLKTFEWDILNPDWLINLEINNKRKTS